MNINSNTSSATQGDLALLPQVVAIVEEAGTALLRRFGAIPVPEDIPQIVATLGGNDHAVLRTLQGALLAVRPGSGWVEDEAGTGPLPAGEWWVTDPAEGNINHAHGLDDWAVSVTLVRDDVAVLAVVHQPHKHRTYTAVRDAGAWLDGAPLHVSAKTDLAAALVGTGQAVPGESALTYRRIGRAVTAMLTDALVVKVAVPATLHLLDVAAGRTDAFWQHSQVRSGLLAGALLVEEAGGTVTDSEGTPGTGASDDFLAATPGVHPAAVATLADAAACVERDEERVA